MDAKSLPPLYHATCFYMTLSYLVSTAGHAQHQNDTHPHDIQSILQLIADGAEEFMDEKVVGFTRVVDDRWICERYCKLSCNVRS